FGTIATDGTGTDTFTADMTLTGKVSASGLVLYPEYAIVSSTGQYSASPTINNSRDWNAIVTTYRDVRAVQSGATNSMSFGPPENNYFSIPDAASLDPSSLTVEAWIKPYSFAANTYYPIAMKTSTTNWTDGYSIELETDGSGNAYLVFWLNDYTGTGGVRLQSWVAITAGQWTHVAGTFDGTNANIYVNGANVGS